MAILNVVLNYIFIPLYGIEGAALGSCLSLIFFNLLKYIYIRAKLQLQPFSKGTLLLIFVLGLAFAAGWYMPQLNNPLLDMMIRSVLITGIVAAGVLGLRISEEASGIFDKMINVIRK